MSSLICQVPWSRLGFMQLMEMVQSCSTEGASSRTPVLVHCVDGASQSGLFCACWIICEKMTLDQQVDIFHTVKALKLKRYHFVNTLVRSWRYVRRDLRKMKFHSLFIMISTPVSFEEIVIRFEVNILVDSESNTAHGASRGKN